jgi:hypothetical protein
MSARTLLNVENFTLGGQDKPVLGAADNRLIMSFSSISHLRMSLNIGAFQGQLTST